MLRGSSKVSPDRRAAVDRAIAELGYRPNAAARTLREGRSRAIGVLLNDVRHPWFFDLLDGLISVLEAEGRHVVLSGGGRLDRRMDDSVLRGFLELEVDGFILAGTQANSPVIAEIANVVPTITVGWRDIDLPRVDAVANDDLLGATLATRHLIDLGHRRIAHISGRVAGTSNVIGKLRQQGYEDTMRTCGLGEHIRVEPGDFTEDAGYRATVRLLNSGQPPTAIFAVDDMTCLGAQSAASEMNIDVPGRLSLVGYDNSYLSRLRSIWITSIDSAGFDAGRLAARTLLARVADPARTAEVHLLAPTLQVRGSTAPPSGYGVDRRDGFSPWTVSFAPLTSSVNRTMDGILNSVLSLKHPGSIRKVTMAPPSRPRQAAATSSLSAPGPPAASSERCSPSAGGTSRSWSGRRGPPCCASTGCG